MKFLVRKYLHWKQLRNYRSRPFFAASNAKWYDKLLIKMFPDCRPEGLEVIMAGFIEVKETDEERAEWRRTGRVPESLRERVGLYDNHKIIQCHYI